MSDLLKTQIQETGRGSTLGLTLAEVVADVRDLGIDPRHVVFSGSSAVVVGQAAQTAPETIGWEDVRAGDEISLIVFDHQEGHVRERRTVVSVDWPKITLAEGGRCYEFDATAPDKVNRAVRREDSARLERALEDVGAGRATTYEDDESFFSSLDPEQPSGDEP